MKEIKEIPKGKDKYTTLVPVKKLKYLKKIKGDKINIMEQMSLIFF